MSGVTLTPSNASLQPVTPPPPHGPPQFPHYLINNDGGAAKAGWGWGGVGVTNELSHVAQFVSVCSTGSILGKTWPTKPATWGWRLDQKLIIAVLKGELDEAQGRLRRVPF